MFADILEPYTLNIFTDASLRKISEIETWTCAGSIAVYGNTIIDTDYRVFKNQTSNFTELKALRLGIDMALKTIRAHPQIQLVNLFSDSQISIYGIRDRIFNWRVINGQLAGYGNKTIVNQDIFLEILQIVTDSKLNIRFYHQKGHSDQISLSASRITLIISNRVVGADEYNICNDFIKFINRYNQIIDNGSRKILYEIGSANQITSPIIFNVGDNYKNILVYYNNLMGGK